MHPKPTLPNRPLTGAAANRPLTGAAALQQLKASGQYESLAAAVNAARYAIQPSADGANRWAQNPAHGLRATFTAHGLALTIQPVTAAGATPATYDTVWRLTSLGYGDQQHLVPAGQLHHTGDRVAVVRPNVTEWFINTASGLEHGFTLPARPTGYHTGTPLRLTIQVDGALTPQVTADGQQLTLRNERGQVLLDYNKLQVWDATGAPLPAHLMTTGRQVHLLVDDATARYPLTIDPTFSQQAYLKANNTGAGDGFAQRVAVDGNTVVVGAPGEDSNATTINGNSANNSATDAGAVYVFVRTSAENGGTWRQQAYLKANNAGAGDGFGGVVAISGNTIAVGAPGEDSNATTVNGDGANNSAGAAGAVYVFVRTGTESAGTWGQQAYLKAHNAGAGDGFGGYVAVDGDTIVVGAIGEDSNATTVNGDGANNSATDAGAAYVFVRTGAESTGTWSQQAYLKAHNTGAGDYFGNNLDIDADTIVVGALFEDSNATTINGDGANNSAPEAGAAYVFVRSAGTWSQQAYLKANNTNAGDYFGFDLGVEGDTVVVGAPLEDSSANTINGDSANNAAQNAGAAYIFVRDGAGAWSQHTYLKAANNGMDDAFGNGVAISGDKILIGAPYEDSNATTINGDGANNSAAEAGAAYLFVRSGTGAGATWSQQTYLKANNSGVTDIFGWHLAIAANTVVIGAMNEDSNATTINGNGANNSASDAGAAYVFFLPTIDIRANGQSITNGDTTPSSADSTAFGNVALGNAVTHTFTLHNLDVADLHLTGTPPVVVTGSTAFTVTIPPTTTIAGSNSASFAVRFAPDTPGSYTATLTIANDDLDEGAYTFVVSGDALPVLNVQGRGQTIASGDVTPSTADGTDLGAVAVNATTSQTFTLQNTGAAPLTISAIAFSGSHASDFSLVGSPPFPLAIAAGGSQVITVQLQPTGAGIRSATLTVTSNDPKTASYTVALQGGIPLPGAALDFDGVNDYVTLPATLNSQFAANQITVEGWFNPASVAGSTPASPGDTAAAVWRGLVAEDFPGSGDVKFTLFQTGATANCGFYTGSAWQWVLNAPITINSWQHIACTYDQQAIKLYINGSQAASAAVSVALPAGTGAWYLGRRWDSTGYYHGRMDEVRIWNRVLSQAEIQATFTCERANNSTGLVARYSFNQGVIPGNNSSIATLIDNSGNNRSGTLVNFGLVSSTSNWIASGAITSDVVCILAPEIGVAGNQRAIPSGANTPSLSDHTAFGTVGVGSSLVRTFTISNTGIADLTTLAVTVDGNAAFQVASQPAATVNPGNSTTFQLRFAPTSAGYVTATVNIANNDSDENPYTFIVGGDAAALPEINLLGKGVGISNGDTTPSLSDDTSFGSVAVGATLVRTFTISNTGAADLTMLATSVTGNGAFQLSTPPAATTLTPGSSTTFQVTFTPASTSNVTATVSIANNDNDENPFTFVIGGAGTAPEIDLQGNGVSITNGDSSPASADDTDFGGVVTGGSLVRTFTIRNLGSLDLTSLTARVSGDAAFHLSSTPAMTVTPGSNTTFNVTFIPTRLGRVVATVSIANNDSDESPYTFVLSGSGATPEIDLQGNSVSIVSGDTTPSLSDQTEFGTVLTGSNRARDFIIRNTGQASLTGIAATISGAGAFSISSAPAASVNAGGNTTLRITFAPTGNGYAFATVSIANSDSDETPYTFVVGGLGAAPVITVQGNSQRIANGDSSPSLGDGTDFGGVAQQDSQRNSFTLHNTGAAPLTVNSLSFTGAHPADFSLVTPPAFPLTIAPGAGQNITVQIRPSAAGVRTANLVISSNDPANSSYSFALQNREVLCTLYPGSNTPLAIPDEQVVAAAVVVPTSYAVADVNVRDVKLLHTYDSDLQFGLVSPAGTLVVLADGRGGAGRHYYNTTFDDAAGTPVAEGSAPFTNSYRPENPLSVLNGSNSQGQWRLLFYDTATGDSGTLYGWSLELCTLLAPNLRVRSNGYTIVHGDSTPNTLDQTFVGATTAGATLTRTFAISNTGMASLTAVAVSVSGNSAFRINTQPATTVNAGGSSRFQLAFVPSSLGVVTATVSIASNDPNANPYTFVVQGAGLEAAPTFLNGWGTEGAGDWMFNKPFGVAVDRSGNLYVADTFNHRIQKFDGRGNLLGGWGAQGSGAGQLFAPFGVAVDQSGNVYVGDTLNQRIQKFSSNSVFLAQWGAKGSGAGQFNNPKGVAVDSSGNVYVADSLNQRIQKFSSSGAFLTQWGTKGSGPGQFDGPANVAVDSRNPNQIYVYVADSNNHRIQKFTGNGAFVSQWGSYGGGAAQLYSPFGLAVDSSGNLYVADSANDRIQKFSSNGSLLTLWGSTGVGAGRFLIPGAIAATPYGHVVVADTFNHRVQIFGQAGPKIDVTGRTLNIANGDTTPSEDDRTDFGRAIVTQLNTGLFTIKNVGTAPLTGVAATVSGNSAFGVSIAPLTTIGAGGASDFVIRFAPGNRGIVTATVSIVSSDPNATPYTFVVQGMGMEAPPAFFSALGIAGGCYGLVAGPSALAQDSNGNIFVVDSFRHCMYKFNRSGSFLTQWGTKGSDNSQFYIPTSVAVDRNGNVFVVDTMNHRVQKFDNNGAFITKWGSKGSGLRQFDTPITIVTSHSDPTTDYLWIVDGENDRVLKYDTNGNFIADLGKLANLAPRPAQRGVAALAQQRSNTIEFNNPTGVATDSNGNIYIIDNDNSRLQKFDNSGAYLTTWATGISSNGQAGRPVALALDSRDPNNVKLYIADPVNNRIRQFDGNGTFLTEWGSTGSGAGEFNNLTGLLVDENGYLYVVDSGNQRIQIFGNPAAKPLMAVQGNGIRIASGDSSPSLHDQSDFGGVITNNSLVRSYTITNSGTADLTGIAVRVSGNAAFSVSAHPAATLSAGSSSTFQLTLTPVSSGQVTATVNISSNDSLANPYTFVVQGLALETATPQSAVMGNNVIIGNGDVTPSHSDHTVIGGITVGGVVSRTFTLYNRGTANLTSIVASINGNGAVQIASQPATTLSPGSSSTFVVTFAPSSVGTVAATVNIASNDNPYSFAVQGLGLETPLPFLQAWGSAGNAPGQFANPYGVATDSLGNRYVVDGNNHRIQVFDREGNFLTQWNTSASSSGQTASPYAVAVDSRDPNAIGIYVADTSNHLIKKFDSSGGLLTFWGSYGRAAGQFSKPTGVAIDSSGNVYVADSFNHRIQKFNSNGGFLAQWGTLGSAAGEFMLPIGIAVDSSGNLYVADSLNQRIQKFNSNGGFLAQWGSFGRGVGQLDRPAALAIDSSGNLYVTDSGNQRLLKFTSSGSLLAQWGDYGSAAGAFAWPYGVATDNRGNLYVADTGNQRIQQFGPLAAIAVTGNNIVLANHDATPTVADNTAFGSVTSGGAPVVHTFAIGNNGAGALNLYNAAQVTVNDGISITTPTATLVTISGSDAFTVTTQPADTVAPNGTTNFAISFVPTAAGVHTATVRLASNDQDDPLFAFVVQGTVSATAAPHLRLTSQQAPNGGLFADASNGSDFGVMRIGSTVTRTYALSNTGDATLTVNAITLSNGTANAFALSGVNLPLTIVAGGSSTFSLRLTPGAVGLFTTTVSITSNDSSQSPLAFAVQGTAKPLPAPEINVQGQGVNIASGNTTPNAGNGTSFGSVTVGNSFTRTYTVSNTGNSDLVVSAITLNGGQNAAFAVSAVSLPLTVTAGSSATFTVSLTPGAVGVYTTTVTIASNDSDENPFTFVVGGQGGLLPSAEIALVGNGQAITNGDSTPDASDGTAFGSTTAGGSAVTRTFTISNSGTAALTAVAVTLDGHSAFSVSTTPASSVAAGSSTSFAVTFAPPISGTFTTTVRIASNDSDENPFTFVVQGAAAGQIDRGDQVTQPSFTAVYQPTPQSCANASAPGLPIHTLTPTLRNNTSNSYQGLYFVVTELGYTAAQGGNLPTLCNADGGNGGGVGARLTVADATLGDGRFAANESFTQAFQVGLPVRARYRLFVNLYAVPATVAAAEQVADSDAADLLGVLSWEFDENGNLITSRQLCLPLVAK